MRRRTGDPVISGLYFRARYYDPATAEFTSPDPLEYVDGMSLFRGYFVPSGFDPNGTVWIKCKCCVSVSFLGWTETIDVDCLGLASTCCKKACASIVDGEIGQSNPCGDWEPTGDTTGIGPCRYFVHFDDVGLSNPDNCGCKHTDIYSTCKGEVRTGFGGSTDADHAPDNPTQFDPKTDVPLYPIGNGTLQYGNVGKKCRDATWVDIDNCIRSYPKPKKYDPTGMIYGENCRTDVDNVIHACCLTGW